MANVKDIFDIDDLELNIERGYVSKRKHPELPLYIFNYTPEAAFANEWNEVTMTCRGLILDEWYNIVARPFRKFFNLNTSSIASTNVENLPKGIAPLVTEKMDGSLGILWRYNGHQGIATRGSFESDQAKWATLNYNEKMLYFPWDDGVTPLFEIIYPENRIVVDYHGESKMTLLGVVRKNDGSEYTYQELKDTGYPDIVPAYEGKSLLDCIQESEMDAPLNVEGYVLRYDLNLPESPYPLRVKVKFNEYLRLHRLIFNLNSKRIWESLSEGKNPLDDVGKIPDDAFQWMSHVVNDFMVRYACLNKNAERVFKLRPAAGSRKDCAEWFIGNADVRSICFAMLDGKNVHDIIWKMLRPEKAEIFRGAYVEEAE
jgi:hypothetical protein